MNHDDNLPKRIAGANLPQLCRPPEGGWFGTEDAWPTEDLDEQTREAVDALLDCEVTADSSLGPLLQRVLVGLNDMAPTGPVDSTTGTSAPPSAATGVLSATAHGTEEQAGGKPRQRAVNFELDEH